MSKEKSKDKEESSAAPFSSEQLFSFVETNFLPLVQYASDPKAYIVEKEREYFTGMDREDFDAWLRNRSKVVLERWEALKENGSSPADGHQ